MYKGDVLTELNAYTAGLNFVRHGFEKLYFPPAILRDEESFDALTKQGLYTHYPPAPDLVSGVLQKLGIHGFYQQKPVMLIRDEQGHTIWYRNLPKDRTPSFTTRSFPILMLLGRAIRFLVSSEILLSRGTHYQEQAHQPNWSLMETTIEGATVC